MKHIIILIIILVCTGAVYSQEAGQISDLASNHWSVSSMEGKKVLVVILPLYQDTAICNQLLRFKSRHADSVQLIGLVCTDSCGSSAEILTGLYSDLMASGVIISEGITEVTPDDVRESVLLWLSGKNKFSRQTEACFIGDKYFLSKRGELYAQLGHETSLDRQIVDNIVRNSLRDH